MGYYTEDIQDRGAADSYYRRVLCPHKYRNYIEGIQRRYEACDMTESEIALYTKGYNENDDFKEWE
jgi:hypothetical protein